jgi:hypothetical protein
MLFCEKKNNNIYLLSYCFGGHFYVFSVQFPVLSSVFSFQFSFQFSVQFSVLSSVFSFQFSVFSSGFSSQFSSSSQSCFQFPVIFFSFKVLRQFFYLQNTFLARSLYTSLNIARTVCMLSSTIEINVNFDVDLQYSVIFFLVKYNVIILQKTFFTKKPIY